ncbi:MAG: metal-dependent hydrolase [Candidatus Riflebacteria bacterium]|nr:metal-dependent hydrolase [Candidatus Riflebacteria bacterium]
MDLVTQGLLGAAVSQAAYGHKGGKKVSIYGFILGLLPDFDVIARLWGPWASLKYHRGPTHSIILTFIFAIPLGIFVGNMAKNGLKKREWIVITMLALVTHPIIDWFTSYGTAMLWPITDKRFAIDCVSILDLVVSMPLLIVTILGIFGLAQPKKVKLLSIAALGLSLGYSAWGYHNSQHLAEVGKNMFQQQGFEAVEVRAMPTIMNISIFRVVGRDANGDFMVTYLKKGSDVPIAPMRLAKSDKGEYVQKASAHEHSKLFKLFAMDMVRASSSINESGLPQVRFFDMRYGAMLSETDGLFSTLVSFDENGEITSVKQVRPEKLQAEFKKDTKETLKRVFN